MRTLILLRPIKIRRCTYDYCGDGCCSYPSWDTDDGEVGEELEEGDQGWTWDFDEEDYIQYMDYMWVQRN